MTVALHFCKGMFLPLETSTLIWEEYTKKKIPNDDWIVTMRGKWFK
ncbi:hypothetical protein ACIKIA_29535 [Bacillus thuringiensis]